MCIRDRYDEDFDDDEDLKDSRFDKVILGAGITVAVVIVVLALYVIARAFNIFPGGGGKETETSATESAIEGTTLASTQTRMPNLIGASVNDVDSIMASSFLKASYQYEYLSLIHISGFAEAVRNIHLRQLADNCATILIGKIAE